MSERGPKPASTDNTYTQKHTNLEPIGSGRHLLQKDIKHCHWEIMTPVSDQIDWTTLNPDVLDHQNFELANANFGNMDLSREDPSNIHLDGNLEFGSWSFGEIDAFHSRNASPGDRTIESLSMTRGWVGETEGGAIAYERPRELPVGWPASLEGSQSEAGEEIETLITAIRSHDARGVRRLRESEAKYNDLKNEHEDLKNENEDLKNENEVLKNEYQKMQEELQKNANMLKTLHRNLLIAEDSLIPTLAHLRSQNEQTKHLHCRKEDQGTTESPTPKQQKANGWKGFPKMLPASGHDGLGFATVSESQHPIYDQTT